MDNLLPLFPFDESNFHQWKEENEEFEMQNLLLPFMKSDPEITILSGNLYVKEVLEGHEMRCRRAFHMENFIFCELVEILRNRGIMDTEKNITVEEQLAMFLYTMSKAASTQTVMDRFVHSSETISRHFDEMLSVMVNYSSELIQPPSLVTHQNIASDTKFKAYFKDCIGAIDGTHVPVTISLDKQDPYRNRKQTLSQNVMLACDFDMRFVYVMAGWEGSASDAKVLQSAIDDGFVVPNGKFYLVDGGYANTPQFIAPYRGVRYHLREQARGSQRPQNAKELFNLRHSQLRNVIERAIGVLKKRFPILRTGSRHPLDKQIELVHAACAIHNFISYHRGEMPQRKRNETDDIDSNLIIDVPEGDENYGNDIPRLNQRRNAGNQMRDEIANRMWHDYISYRDGV